MRTELVSRHVALQPRGWLRHVVSGLMVFALPLSAALAQADSISIWTNALQSGDAAAKGAAVDGLSRVSTSALPPGTQQALLVELNRVHAAYLNGTDPGMPGTSEDHGDYYMRLVGIVTDLRSQDAALTLVPAIEVSGTVKRRVARYGGDSAVVLLVDLIGRRNHPDDALETLGLVWFWSDSTGSTLSEASRGRIVLALTGAAATGDDADMLGVSAALLYMKDPAFLALAQNLRSVAAAHGATGAFTVQRLDRDVLPALTVAAAARSNAALVSAIPQLIAAACSTTSNTRRQGVCQSVANAVDNASKHFASGMLDQARQEYSTALDKLARAKDAGVISAPEYALMSGDISALLLRSW